MRISLEDALNLALIHTDVLPQIRSPLEDALQRVLAQPVRAAIDQPPFSRSPLDGYAVRGDDTKGASPDHPAVLRVVGKRFAGQSTRIKVGPGEAVRLMTGTMLPDGADSVIPQEDTDRGEGLVRVFHAVSPGSNYCRRGEEYQAGEEVLAAGTKLDAAALAVAAGNGMTELPIYPRVRAAVISTGNEVRNPGQPLPSGKIYDSNTAYLSARLRQMGVVMVERRSARDEIPEIAAALRECAQADIIITTGGVSVGEKDCLEQALKESGSEIFFHGIDMKPGMPTLLAKQGRTLILGLSGNPFAAAVPFELLVRPMVAKMTCDPGLVRGKGRAIMKEPFEKASPTRRFLRGHSDGRMVSVPGRQANGQMRSMVGCNCLVDIPAGTGPVAAGEEVSIIWI